MLKNILKTLCLLGFVATAHAQSVTDFQRNDNAATTLQNTNLGRMPQASTSFGRAFNNADKYVAGNLDMTDTNSAVSILADGYTSVTIRYTRTAQTGSILPQTSVDGVTWANAYYYVTTAGSTTISPTVSSNNITFAGQEVLKVPCEGALYVRILVFGAGTGSLPVTLIAKNGLIYTAINNILPGTAAANLGKAEDSAHTSGDTGVFGLGVANTNATTLAAEGDYVGGAHGTNGAYLVDLKRSLQVSDAGSLLKAEDAAAGSGDTGVMNLGVRNDSNIVLTTTDLDYSPLSVSARGQLWTLLGDGGTSTMFKVEDGASSDGQPVVAAGFVREDALTTNTSNSGDYTWGKTDGNGRVITTGAPPGETWQSCSSSNTGTSDVAIKAAVASNRIYVTSISCFNTANVASSFQIRDGTTAIWVGGISSSSLAGVGVWGQTFTTPLRGTSNTALNFLMATTATATTCCANGYISVL